MLLPPLLISLTWIVVARSRRDTPGATEQAPLVPGTVTGWLALASLSLMIVVALASASLASTLPVGIVMLGLASFARWRQRDQGTLLVLPLVFGAWLIVVPISIGVWNALHDR